MTREYGDASFAEVMAKIAEESTRSQELVMQYNEIRATLDETKDKIKELRQRTSQRSKEEKCRLLGEFYQIDHETKKVYSRVKNFTPPLAKRSKSSKTVKGAVISAAVIGSILLGVKFFYL